MYYTGEEQIASIIASGQSVDSTPVTFTYSDKVDGDYTSDGPAFTDAGTYTVTTKRKQQTTNGCRYVHRNHCPAADQPSLRRKNLQVLRRHRKRHAYREQADILQHGGQSFGHYTSRYGAHLL